MLKNIIINEWRDFYADKTLFLLLLIFVAAIAYGIYNGESAARQQAQTEKKISPLWDAKLAELKMQLTENSPSSKSFGVALPQNPYLMSAQKIDVALPPAPLAVLSVGQSDLYPNNTQAYLWSDADNLFAKNDLQNPLNLIIGRFDLAFVVIFLFPLVILAFSYNLLSAEKENGTLALLLSQAVTLQQILLGKVLARAIIIFSTLILTVLIGLLVTHGFSTNNGIMKFLLWCATVLLYGAFWFALAVLVNSFDYNSATNAGALAGFWLLFVIVIPSLLNTIGTIVYPMPPRSELIVAGRDSEPDVDKEGQRVLAKFYEDHPELRPTANEAEISDFRRQLLMVFLNNREAAKPLVEKYDRQLIEKQRFIKKLSFTTPAVLMQETVNDLAGTGFVRYQNFRGQVHEFIESNRQYYVPKIIRGEKLSADDYDSIPRFRFQEESIGGIFGRFFWNLAGLFFLSLTCVSGIFYKMRGFSVAK